jgi:hypothetical protein
VLQVLHPQRKALAPTAVGLRSGRLPRVPHLTGKTCPGKFLNFQLPHEEAILLVTRVWGHGPMTTTAHRRGHV